MLVQGDVDGKSDSISKDKETLSLLNSIFLCIKRSEDAVDAAKSQVWFLNTTILFFSFLAYTFIIWWDKITLLQKKVIYIHKNVLRLMFF